MEIYAEVEIEWRGAQTADAMTAAAMQGIEAGAELFAKKIRHNIDTPSPPASVPGEFPHLRSGDLLRSVVVIPDRRRKTFHVAAAAEHAAAVESSRPFVRRTYLENKSAVRQAVLDRTRQAYGHFRIAQ